MTKPKTRPNKSKKGKWSALDEVRHPMPKPGFAFKDRKRMLKDEQDREDMKDY